MKVNLPDTVTPEDLPALTMGLYYTAKGLVTENLGEPVNSVEFTLQERTQDIFSTYLSSMRDSLLRLTKVV